MSIRPIDMQVTVQRSDQYSREFNKNIQLENNQQGISSEIQKQAARSQQQVASTEATENNVIDKDGTNKHNQSKQDEQDEKNTKGKAEENTKKGSDRNRGVFIDISI